jgi:hypothetical protein
MSLGFIFVVSSAPCGFRARFSAADVFVLLSSRVLQQRVAALAADNFLQS